MNLRKNTTVLLLATTLFTLSGCGKDIVTRSMGSSPAVAAQDQAQSTEDGVTTNEIVVSANCTPNASVVTKMNYVRAIDTTKTNDTLVITRNGYLSKGDNSTIMTFEGKDYPSEGQLEDRADVFDLKKNLTYKEGDSESDALGILVSKSEDAKILKVKLALSAADLAQMKKEMIDSSEGSVTDVCSIDTSSVAGEINRTKGQVSIQGQIKIQFVMKTGE